MAKKIDLAVGPVRTKALVAMPGGDGPFPGIVVTYHREGLDAFTAWKVDHLAAAGFAWRKVPGYGRKREMLAGEIAAPPADKRRAHTPWFSPPPARPPPLLPFLYLHKERDRFTVVLFVHRL